MSRVFPVVLREHERCKLRELARTTNLSMGGVVRALIAQAEATKLPALRLREEVCRAVE